MQYREFKKTYGISGADIARQVYGRNPEAMQIKKEKTAVQNLEKIFNAVFTLAGRKGFQAMSMRDLSKSAGLSLGALYAYFPGKEKLLEIIQSQGWIMIRDHLEEAAREHEDPWDRLESLVKAHVFLSELHRPWFYFTFMEARHIKPASLDTVKFMEAHTQKMITDILEEGRSRGVFKDVDLELTASMIKSMQQEWYLKRWKYRQMKVGVDAFAEHLVAMVAAFCRIDPEPR